MKNEENKIQEAIVEYLRWRKIPVFAVPNGGRRNAREMVYLKRQGLLPGAPDLVVFHKGKVVFLEIKTDKGKLSQMQKEFQGKCQEHSINYVVVRKLEEAVSKLGGVVTNV